MSDLELIGKRYVTVEPPNNLSYLKIRKNIEGGARRLSDNRLSFAATKYNAETWLSAFPLATISSTQEKEKQEIVAIPFKFKREPRPWQAKAFEKSKGKPYFAFIFKTGLGKSKALVDYATWNYCQGNIDRVLIITPNYTISYQWIEEAFNKDCFLETNRFLYNPKRKPKEEFNDFLKSKDFKVFAINIDAMKTAKGKELVQKFLTPKTLFCVDEVHVLKNGKSQNHKICEELGTKVFSRVGLSATMSGNNLVDSFYIYKWIDENIIGIRYVTHFKRKYCELRWNGFADEIVGYKNVEDFKRRIEPFTAVASLEDAGLTQIYDEIIYELSDEQKKAIKEFRKNWKLALVNGEFATASIALTARMKIRQISSGFVTMDDGTVKRFKSGKVDALKDILSLHEGKKIFIWVAFLEEAKMLMEALPNALDFSGNVDKEERVRNKERLINDASILYGVGTPQASGTGMDGLQLVCDTAIFFSNNYSHILRTQAEGRTCRVGGSDTALYIDMIGKGSDDRHTLDILQGKKELNKVTFADLERVFDDDP